MGVLESVSAAMPGLGFLAGGLVASGFAPRAAFLFAGSGAIAVVIAAVPVLRRYWIGEGYGPEPRTDP